jgi:ribosomal protein L27
MNTNTATITAPTPIRTSSRTCYGVQWFATEDDAMTMDAIVRERGDRYNGGYYDGMRCGRDTSLDVIINGKPAFAVTTH